MWVIVEAITFGLNPIVLTCVMNQSRGHQFLSNALTITIAFIMNMKVKFLQVSSGPKIFEQFESKILLFHKNMQLEIMKVIISFLEFLKSFDTRRVHHMMGIMLNPHFKLLPIMEILVEHGNAIQLASKSNVKVVIPLLMVCFDQLNPIANAYATIVYSVLWD